MRLLTVIATIVMLGFPFMASAQVSDIRYLKMFEFRCATCHGSKSLVERAITRSALGELSPERIFKALTTGAMAPLTTDISEKDKRGLAIVAAGSPFGSSEDRSAAKMANRCDVASGRGSKMGDPFAGPAWNGMSTDHTSSRFQTTRAAGLTARQVPKLRKKWAFGFPGGTHVRAQPTVAGGRVFMGSDAGTVYAIDAETGCVHWSFDAKNGVVTAVSIGQLAGSPKKAVAYISDMGNFVHALDAETGEPLWRVRVDDHVASKITGSPVLDTRGGRLYVPVSSFEETYPAIPEYECCTSRGIVVALDAATGKQIWKTYTIEEAPKPVRKSAVGTQLYGPSGAGVWTAPTLDYERGVLYVGTANGYIDVPDGGSSDAIIAYDLDTGERRWSTQLLEGDFNCVEVVERDEVGRRSCEDPRVAGEAVLGNDDVSGSPILHTLRSGRQILIAGQESGRITALDPDDDGAVVWMTNTHDGQSWPNGSGLGAATEGELYFRGVAFCPNSAAGEACEADETGKMVALRAATGEEVWSTLHPKPENCADPEARTCSGGVFGAATTIPGVVFAATRDGKLRAYSTADGKVMWEYNTRQEFATVNGVRAKGGSFGGHSPSIVDGMLFVGSGYNILGTESGNVLLAFGIE